MTVMISMLLSMALAQDAVKAVAENAPVAQASSKGETPGTGGGARNPEERPRLSTTTSLMPRRAAVGGGEVGYRIGAEDVLQIDVWKESDFSTSTPVRPDGKISVPLLNDVQAAGLTPIELAESLRDKLSKFVIDPRITVIVSQTNSRKAYVMGMVTRQGTVRLLSNLTVLQAISASGGLAQFAKSRQIYVLRNEGEQQRRLPFNYDAVIKGKHPEQNILLQPGDTIVVP